MVLFSTEALAYTNKIFDLLTSPMIAVKCLPVLQTSLVRIPSCRQAVLIEGVRLFLGNVVNI
jgi:hypothetical protein